MKKSILFQFIGIVTLMFAVSCAPKYFGKTYAPTTQVDVFLDAADVKKGYTVMGTADVGQGFSSMDAMQQKVINLGKQRGADGVIMKLTEEVTGSSKSDFGNVSTGKKNNNTYSGSSITNNTKVTKVQATFIKYN